LIKSKLIVTNFESIEREFISRKTLIKPVNNSIDNPYSTLACMVPYTPLIKTFETKFIFTEWTVTGHVQATSNTLNSLTTVGTSSAYFLNYTIPGGNVKSIYLLQIPICSGR